MRNVLAVVPRAGQEMVASIIRTVFAQPDTEHVNAQFDEVTRMLAKSHPKVAQMLHDARPDLLAFAGFPAKHWRQIWSTNPMERVNKEIKRRTDVVGVFPNPAALLRLAGAVLIEQHDEWEAGDRRYLSEASMAALHTLDTPSTDPVEEAITPQNSSRHNQSTDPHGVEETPPLSGTSPQHGPPRTAESAGSEPTENQKEQRNATPIKHHRDQSTRLGDMP